MSAYNDIERYFPERIKRIREEKGFTQESLAEGLHVSKGAVGMWETGKRTPTLKKLNEIAEFLDCRLDYLIGKSEDSFSSKAVGDAILKDNQRLDREFYAGIDARDYEAVIEAYAALDSFGKKAVDAVLATETERCEETGSLRTTEWLTAKVHVDISHIPELPQEDYLKDILSFVPAPLTDYADKSVENPHGL